MCMIFCLLFNDFCLLTFLLSFRSQHILLGFVHNWFNNLFAHQYQIYPVYTQYFAQYSQTIRFSNISIMWNIHNSCSKFLNFYASSKSITILRVVERGDICFMLLSIFLVCVNKGLEISMV